MFILILAQAAAMQNPPGISHAKGNGGHLISKDDYPAEAVRNHWQGRATADLTIDKTGRVAACKIVKSTGHQVLDDATCSILARRALFKPATDQNGNPTEQVVRTPEIVWRLPSLNSR
jgi:protein TonB